MADISALGGLTSSEPLDMENYEDVKVSSGGGFQLPPAGIYTLRAPESFPAEAFGASQAGALTAQIDPTIVGPTNEGTQVRFIRVSAKTFPRGNGLASRMGDYLRACGNRAKLDGTPQALANAVEQTAGAVYQAKLDWKAYRKLPDGSKFELKGMDNFPRNAETGTHQSWVEAKDSNGNVVKDAETGEPIRARANLDIVAFVAAS